MQQFKINNFGNTYIFTEEEIPAFHSLANFFAEEEHFILQLKQEKNLVVREDLLILFVQMYILRFAIPYFQIAHHRFPTHQDINFLKTIFYYCMIGRCIDDLIDKDSKMFLTYESIFLYQKYHEKLYDILDLEQKGIFSQYLFDSTKYKSPIVNGELHLNHLINDVYNRIKYFFCTIEKFEEEKAEQLKFYVSIMLGGLDLNDLIADGYQLASSTVVSNFVYGKCFNDEGKLLLDSKLLNTYSEIRQMLSNTKDKLLKYAEFHKLYYIYHILNQWS
jgi:hypothetical protein